VSTAMRLALLAATLTIAAASTAHAQGAIPKPDSSGYIAANGVSYWFEMHGQGEPLLLLHGGLGSTGMFGPVLTKLAEQRRVIDVDLQGHGRTTLGARKISLIDIGNDLATVLQKLGYRQVDAMGYSFGAGAAFRLAVQHPALVRRLVLASGGYAQDGFYAEMLPQQAQVGAAMAEAMKNTPPWASTCASPTTGRPT